MSGIISLKRNSDFCRIYRRGSCAVRGTLVVYAAANRRGPGRLGITAGKKVGCAVRRNKAKRRIRALYRELVPEDIGADMVVVARAAAVTAPFSAVRADFISAAHEAVKKINKKK